MSRKRHVSLQNRYRYFVRDYDMKQYTWKHFFEDQPFWFLEHTQDFEVAVIGATRRVARIWKRGGRLFWESEKNADDPWPEFWLFLNQFHTVFSKIQTKFLGNSKVFFRPKSGGLQKKKKRSSPKLSPIFRPKSEIQRFFPPKNRWSPKKKKEKKRSSPKLSPIFRPKSEIQTFFAPKNRWSPKKKKKKGLRQIESDFSAEIRNSNVFSAQTQVVSKKKEKKRFSPKDSWVRFIGQIRKFKRFRGGCFLMGGGGLFSIFHKKSASKALKTCDFEYFTSQWGGLEPPRPPWLRYWVQPGWRGCSPLSQFTWKFNLKMRWF